MTLEQIESCQYRAGWGQRAVPLDKDAHTGPAPFSPHSTALAPPTPPHLPSCLAARRALLGRLTSGGARDRSPSAGSPPPQSVRSGGSIMKDLSSAGSGAETAAGRTLQPAKGTFPSRHIPDRWLKAPEESCLCLRGDENGEGRRRPRG